MSGLDVEAARKVLLDSLPPRDPKWRIWVDGVVERLADCVVEGVPPGRCESRCESAPSLWCELRAGHAGAHEARQYPPGEWSVGVLAYWTDR